MPKVSVITLFIVWLGACGTPRIQDALAPSQYRAAARPFEACAPAVEVLRSPGELNRPYREVANLSATCYPGTPIVCERQLLDRACQLRAHAILLTETQSGGTPMGVKDSRIAQSAIAVRWTGP